MTKYDYLLPFGILCILAGIAVYAVAYFTCEDKTDPGEIVARSQAIMYGLQSYRSQSTTTAVTNEGTSIITNTKAYVAPDHYHCKRVREDSWLEYIFIGEDHYYRASYGPEWRKDGVFEGRQISVRISDDFSHLNSLPDITRLPSQTIDGAKCFHYQAIRRPQFDIDARLEAFEAQLLENPELLAGTESPGMEETLRQYHEQLERSAKSYTTIDIWIDQKEYLLRQMEIINRSLRTDPQNAEDWDTQTTVYRWYDFNEDFAITAPEVGVNPANNSVSPSPASLTMPGTPVFHTEAGIDPGIP